MSELRNKTDYNLIFHNLFDSGIISLGDVMNSHIKEELMATIIDTIHRYAITKTNDGRYTTYVMDNSKPNRRRQIRRKSKTELYKTLLEHYGVNDTPQDITFEELFKEWKQYKMRFIDAPNKKRSISPSTIRRYERDYDKYLKDTDFVNMPLRKITAPKLQLALSNIIENSNMNEKCAGNLIGYITQALAYAKLSQYIDNNPADNIDKKLLLSMCSFTPPKADSDRVLTISELAKLREATLDHSKRYPNYMPDYAIELAILIGARVGEVSALHWSDIYDDKIHINYSEHRLDYADKKCELVIGAPKNCKSRTLPLTDDIRDVLDKIRALGIQSKDDFVFVHEDGHRYTAHDISCAVDRRASEAGIKKTSIHGIRRTVSSQLNTILPQKDVASLLGHSERVNERHYNYSTAENSEKRQALLLMSSKVIKHDASNDTKKITQTP